VSPTATRRDFRKRETFEGVWKADRRFPFDFVWTIVFRRGEYLSLSSFTAFTFPFDFRLDPLRALD
jgi:hypothetical protein